VDPDERVIDQKADLVSVIVEGPVFTGGAVDMPTELEVEPG
jgi:hypothetical protein